MTEKNPSAIATAHHDRLISPGTAGGEITRLVARRVRELQAALRTVLFDESRAGDFVLTPEGHHLLSYADAMEATVLKTVPRDHPIDPSYR